jgi:hypothetical protein
MWFWIGFALGLLVGLFIAWMAFALDEVSRDHEFDGE